MATYIRIPRGIPFLKMTYPSIIGVKMNPMDVEHIKIFLIIGNFFLKYWFINVSAWFVDKDAPNPGKDNKLVKDSSL